MKQYLQPMAWGLAMATMVATASTFALSMVAGTAQAAVAHDHGQAHAPLAGVASGERWASDAALREGMTRIHEALERNLPHDPQQPLGDDQATALRHDIEAAAGYLVANCQLPAAADAALHGLLAELLQGAATLPEAGRREQALARIASALEHYPQLFDEPLWRDGFGARLH